MMLTITSPQVDRYNRLISYLEQTRVFHKWPPSSTTPSSTWSSPRTSADSSWKHHTEVCVRWSQTHLKLLRTCTKTQNVWFGNIVMFIYV